LCKKSKLTKFSPINTNDLWIPWKRQFYPYKLDNCFSYRRAKKPIFYANPERITLYATIHHWSLLIFFIIEIERITISKQVVNYSVDKSIRITKMMKFFRLYITSYLTCSPPGAKCFFLQQKNCIYRFFWCVFLHKKILSVNRKAHTYI